MELSGKRFVILVDTQFNDHEFWYPYFRLKEAGAEVTVVASAAGKTYEGKYGTPAKADKTPAEISVADYAGIIIPGGYAPDHMRRDQNMVSLVRAFDQQGKVVAAICHAGWMLVSAGILKGRTVTSFFAIKDDLVNAGATWRDHEVVTDRNMITSRTPDDLPAFMRTIIAACKG
ncbi:type 1 glutamine amidotransferase domain-containing protein [Desulfomicrobium escambiense]|uniref:type 1 glutamine amidotransferase domain-containing protein n=1 Tax=Desulfomicrobium escambiense TaxID=29503 RepID=UPI00041A93CE|nr:type 1 glutamine amidotransferase domain-containing protein [Desulfomicrobium escambiense]